MTKANLIATLSALSICSIAVSAHAGSNARVVDKFAPVGLADLSQLNLIVLGNMSGGDDVEGKTFIGGNLTNAATYGIGRSGVTVPSSGYETLTVGGNASGNINIGNGANVSGPYGALIGGNAGTVSINASPASLTVGGTVGNFNANGDSYSHGGGTAVSGPIKTQTATLTHDLGALSDALALLTTTGSVTNTDPNNFTLSATANAAGFAVIDVTAQQLATASNIIYAFSKSTPTIINVTGPAGYSFTDLANNNNGDVYASSVLWNFVGASNVNLQRQEEGGVLAPFAALTNTTPIEGSVAVASFTQGGEVHLGTFLGNAGLSAAVSGVVPEPATWTMMLGGLGLLGAALRRRRVVNGPAVLV